MAHQRPRGTPRRTPRGSPSPTGWCARWSVELGADGGGSGPVIGDLMLAVGDGWAQAEVAAAARASEAELGWVLDPAYAGRGLATEAVRALLETCFTTLGLRRVTAQCFADNTASWRLMERLGMRRETHAVRESLHRELGWLDSFGYAVLAEEWCAARELYAGLSSLHPSHTACAATITPALHVAGGAPLRAPPRAASPAAGRPPRRGTAAAAVADLHQRDVGEAGLPVSADRLHDRVEVGAAGDLLGDVLGAHELGGTREAVRSWAGRR